MALVDIEIKYTTGWEKIETLSVPDAPHAEAKVYEAVRAYTRKGFKARATVNGHVCKFVTSRAGQPNQHRPYATRRGTYDNGGAWSQTASIHQAAEWTDAPPSGHGAQQTLRARRG